MRHSVFVRRALASACLPLSWSRGRAHPGVRILMYHRVLPQAHGDQLAVGLARFEQQIAHLARRARVLHLADAVDALAAGRLDTPAVVLTFDDGYRDNLVHALPVLRRHGIPATIFVTAEFCDQTRRHPRYANEPGRLHLDWGEVAALAAEPLITIGSHTLSHAHLSRLTDADAAREIGASRERIAARIGESVDFFCYPSGDFGAREERLVREAGYRAAVSVAPGANCVGAPMHALHRTEMTDRDRAADLALKLSGAYDLMHAWLHRRRSRRFARLATAAQAVRNLPGDAA